MKKPDVWKKDIGFFSVAKKTFARGLLLKYLLCYHSRTLKLMLNMAMDGITALNIPATNEPLISFTTLKYMGPNALPITNMDVMAPFIAPRCFLPNNFGMMVDKIGPINPPAIPIPMMAPVYPTLVFKK